MTYEEVVRTGAEPIRFSWTRHPVDGWQEAGEARLRALIAESAQRLTVATTAQEHQAAQGFKTGATVGLERLQVGERVFWAPMGHEMIFMSTKAQTA